MKRDDLVWLCSECHKPIGDHLGDLRVDLGAAQTLYLKHHAIMAETGPWERLPLERFEDDPIPWRALHDTCEGRVSGSHYYVPIDHVRTLRDFIDTTAHLMGKRWLGETNWREVMCNVAAPEGVRL